MASTRSWGSGNWTWQGWKLEQMTSTELRISVLGVEFLPSSVALGWSNKCSCPRRGRLTAFTHVHPALTHLHAVLLQVGLCWGGKLGRKRFLSCSRSLCWLARAKFPSRARKGARMCNSVSFCFLAWSQKGVAALHCTRCEYLPFTYQEKGKSSRGDLTKDTPDTPAQSAQCSPPCPPFNLK